MNVREYTSCPSRVMCHPHENTRRAPGRAWSSTAWAVPDEYWFPHGASTTPEEAKTKAAATYNAAADSYDHPANALLSSAGVEESSAVAESGSQPLGAPEDWWPMVLGTGYRGTIEQLEAGEREQVRRDCLRFIRATQVRSVETNVVYAVATRGRDASRDSL